MQLYKRLFRGRARMASLGDLRLMDVCQQRPICKKLDWDSIRNIVHILCKTINVQAQTLVQYLCRTRMAGREHSIGPLSNNQHG